MHFLLEPARTLLLLLCSAALPATHGLAVHHPARSAAAEFQGIRVIPHLGRTGIMRADAGDDEEAIENDEDAGSPAAPVVSVEVRSGVDSFDVAVVLVDGSGVDAFERSQALRIGIGPCLFIVDTGTASDGRTARFGVYGLLAGPRLAGGIGLEGGRSTLAHGTRTTIAARGPA